MNEQNGGGSVAPLFYIIQPEIQIKRSEQNNQEIYHSREVIVESPLVGAKLEQDDVQHAKAAAAAAQSMREIQEEVKQISSEFNIPVNIQAEAMKKMEELGAVKEEPVHLEKEAPIASEVKSVAEVSESEAERKKAVRMTVTRLARYPLVVPKPVCELTIQGEKVNAIIESKRGEMVRLRVGSVTKSFSIDEIEDIKIV